MKYALYKIGENSIECIGQLNDQGALVCNYTCTSLLDMLIKKVSSPEDDGQWVITTLDKACALIDLADDKLCGKYVQITEGEWWDALGCLPPEKWKRIKKASIFRMMEYYTSNITSHFIEIGDVYYTVMHRNTKPYEEIADEVSKLINNPE